MPLEKHWQTLSEMKTKKIQPLKLDADTAGLIAASILAYANAAYPPGGSECAQATHQSLKDLAIKFSRPSEQGILLKKRQLPLIKAAIRWFYSEEGTGKTVVDPEALVLKLS